MPSTLRLRSAGFVVAKVVGDVRRNHDTVRSLGIDQADDGAADRTACRIRTRIDLDLRLARAVSQVPITDGAWAEAAGSDSRKQGGQENFRIISSPASAARRTTLPAHRSQAGGRSPDLLDQCPAIERRHDPPRCLGRTFHVRHKILHDPGTGVQLPVGELLQDHRSQQFVIGRRQRPRQAPRAGGMQDRARRSTNAPAASWRVSSSEPCRSRIRL